MLKALQRMGLLFEAVSTFEEVPSCLRHIGGHARQPHMQDMIVAKRKSNANRVLSPSISDCDWNNSQLHKYKYMGYILQLNPDLCIPLN